MGEGEEGGKGEKGALFHQVGMGIIVSSNKAGQILTGIFFPCISKFHCKNLV